MAEKACKLLLEVDEYFNNEIVDVTKFDSKKSYFEYKCPRNKLKEYKCTNNNERINALGAYLYQKLGNIANDFKGEGDNGNRHIEIFMMWLGDKLYKLEKNKAATLDESYKNNLEKHTGNYKYWNILGSKQEYKIANVWYMSELYSLLNNICSIVIEYKKDKNKQKIEQISSKCYKEFVSIYKDIKECYSYFHLLEFLKKIYDDIRNDAIKDANTKKEGIKHVVTRDNNFRRVISKQKKDSKQILQYVLDASTISLIDLTPQNWNQRFSNDSNKIVDLQTKNCGGLHSEIARRAKKDISKETPTPQFQPEPLSASQKSGTPPQSGTKDSSTQKENSDSEGDGKEGTNNLSGSTGGGPGTGASGGQSDQGGSPGGSDSQGGSDDGSKASGDQAPTHPSGKSNGNWLGNLGMSLNLTGYISSVSGIYESSKNILTNTANQIRSAYNSAKAIAQDTYSAATNYIGGAVNSITTQFNQFGTYQLGDNRSGSNSLGGGVNTSDQSQQKSIDSPTRSTLIHQIGPTGGNMRSQTLPSGQDTLPISGSNPLNTKKENVNTVANFKVKEVPSIWCIGTNTKCDITGISIIVISIFAFLAIMYKYLSLGWTSKSKRKKNIKKVINSIGGKKLVQIIIKSYDRNKDLKPIINSADPVPFINLFFLLIFFVYKKKLNYLEL
ncbi:hypothetical protein YYE_01342 [Plasmodium vinckei vinckei]|nr:hypothetical protein YYE_01342 [Plasmodium vinckei vinckei]